MIYIYKEKIYSDGDIMTNMRAFRKKEDAIIALRSEREEIIKEYAAQLGDGTYIAEYDGDDFFLMFKEGFAIQDAFGLEIHEVELE